MKKAELRAKFHKYRHLTQRRLRNEEAIIDALPAKLDIVRVIPAKGEGSPEDGGIEIEVPDYERALTLVEQFRELTPIPMVVLELERTPGHKTRSFLPLCRVPMRWYKERENGGAAYAGPEEIFPVVVQLCPSDDPLRPKVVFESFAELRHELIVSVRVTVKSHPVTWRTNGEMPHKRKFTWPGAPDAPYARVLYTKEGQPPFVTLWWDDEFGYFPHVIHGQEVGHVND